MHAQSPAHPRDRKKMEHTADGITLLRSTNSWAESSRPRRQMASTAAPAGRAASRPLPRRERPPPREEPRPKHGWLAAAAAAASRRDECRRRLLLHRQSAFLTGDCLDWLDRRCLEAAMAAPPRALVGRRQGRLHLLERRGLVQFDLIQCITLRERPERRAAAERQFELSV